MKKMKTKIWNQFFYVFNPQQQKQGKTKNTMFFYLTLAGRVSLIELYLSWNFWNSSSDTNSLDKWRHENRKTKSKVRIFTCYHYTTFLWSQDNLQRKNIEEKLDIFMKIHKWLDSLEKLKFSFCKLNSHINNVSSELINGIF